MMYLSNHLFFQFGAFMNNAVMYSFICTLIYFNMYQNCMESVLKHKSLGPPTVSDSVGLGYSPSIHISNKSSGDTDAAGLRNTL